MNCQRDNEIGSGQVCEDIGDASAIDLMQFHFSAEPHESNATSTTEEVGTSHKGSFNKTQTQTFARESSLIAPASTCSDAFLRRLRSRLRFVASLTQVPRPYKLEQAQRLHQGFARVSEDVLVS